MLSKMPAPAHATQNPMPKRKWRGIRRTSVPRSSGQRRAHQKTNGVRSASSA